MNPDFTFNDSKPDELAVCYCGEVIALFKQGSTKKDDPRTLREQADDYVRVYGYMAEWRRRWLNGDRISWCETLRVVV